MQIDDLDRRIELADAGRRPYPVRPRRHAHVEEDHRERALLRQRLLHGRHGRVGLIAEHRLEADAVAARPGAGAALLVEQPAAQRVEAGHLAADLALEQDLAVGIAHLGLIVDHEYANG